LRFHFPDQLHDGVRCLLDWDRYAETFLGAQLILIDDPFEREAIAESIGETFPGDAGIPVGTPVHTVSICVADLVGMRRTRADSRGHPLIRMIR
jgi:hypothetical protein